MLSDEELVDRYAECVQGYGPGYDATLAFRAELLRRLSAGNSHADNVPISNLEPTYCMRDHVCCNALRELLQIAAERDVCVNGHIQCGTSQSARCTSEIGSVLPAESDIEERAKTNMRKALDYRAITGCECSCHGGLACEVCRGILAVDRQPAMCSVIRALYGLTQADSGEQRETRITEREYEKLTAMGGKEFADAVQGEKCPTCGVGTLELHLPSCTGRITDADLRDVAIAEYLAPSLMEVLDQSETESRRLATAAIRRAETRIHGESAHAYDGCHDCRVASAANVDREPLVAMVEAQRSAGRIEAGSEQPRICSCFSAPLDGTAHQCDTCQDSKMVR